MPLKINLGPRGEVELPVFNGGVFEDCEEQFNVAAQYWDKADGKPPMGATARAFIDIAHRALKDSIPDLSREEVARSFVGMRAMIELGVSIVESFGLPQNSVSTPGEVESPSRST